MENNCHGKLYAAQLIASRLAASLWTSIHCGAQTSIERVEAKVSASPPIRQRMLSSSTKRTSSLIQDAASFKRQDEASDRAFIHLQLSCGLLNLHVTMHKDSFP